MRRVRKTEKKNYKRILALCIVIMTAAVIAAGCGGGDDEESSSQEKERAADKYAKVLTDKDGTYYLKVESGEETSDSADIFKDTQIMAQEGSDKKYVSSEANNSKQYYMDGKLYYYDGNAMTYYVMDQGTNGDNTNDAYAPAEDYKKTKEKDFDGQQMECDIYENETTEEGVELINRTEYYVDDKGDLKGIISEQLNKSSMKLVSRVTMKVQEFETKIPEGIFTRPDGYEEIKEEDH